MPKTRDEFISRVADVLNVRASNQPLSAEDSQTIDGFIDPAFAELAVDRVIYIGNAEAIPDHAFLPLADYVANEAAETFGQEKDDGKRMTLRMRLRSLSRAPYTYTTLATNYF